MSWRRLTGPDRAFAGVLVVATVAWVVLMGSSAYIYDDFIYFEGSVDKGLDGGWLNTTFFQHWAPLHRLSFWAIQRISPLTWWIGFVPMLAMLLGASLALWLVLRELYGPRWLHVGLAALMPLSVLHVFSFQWASAGYQTFPDAAFSLAAIWFFLRHRRLGGWPSALAAGAMTILCLGFYIRGALIPVWCLTVWLLLQPGVSRRPREIAATLRRDWRVWACLLIPVIAYVIHYFADHIAGDQPKPTLVQLEQYLRIAWLRGFTPSWLTGVVIPPVNLTTGNVVAEVFTQVALVAVVAVALIRNPGAAVRAVVFYLVAFGATVGLVAFGRLGTLGVDIGYDFRYLSPLAWLCPLAIAAAFAPGARRQLLRVPATVGLAIGAAALLVHGAIAYDGAKIMHRAWPTEGVKTYFATLRTSLDDARRLQGGRPVQMLDQITPEQVIYGNSTPYNHLRKVVPLFSGSTRFDTTARQPWVANGLGQLFHVQARTFRTVLPDTMVATPNVVRPIGAHGRCARDQKVFIEYRPPKGLNGHDWGVRVKLSSPAPDNTNINNDPGTGYAVFSPGNVLIDSKPIWQQVDFQSNTLTGVHFELNPGVCLEGLQIVFFQRVGRQLR